MAKATICDGCSTAIDGEGQRIGFVLRGDYCDECAPLIAEYGAAIDVLHDKVANEFKTGLAKIRIKYAKRVKTLPDVTRV